jgi:hypothetical protein
VELHVNVKINPPPETVDKKEVDRLLDGELSRFEKHFSHVQKEKGMDGAPLAAFERGVLKAYLYYAATVRDADV